MPQLSTRLKLPLGNYIGPRGPGTIKTIEAGTFQEVEDNFPLAITAMLVSYENVPVYYENEVVWT